MKQRKRAKTNETPASIPEPPRPIPDVEIPPLSPDVWGDEGGGGSDTTSPTGREPKHRRERG
jgi:hypothetical protein